MSRPQLPSRRSRPVAALRLTVPVALAGLLLVAAQVAFAVAPANTTPPSISGNETVGQTLTADPGVWDDPAATFSYAWSRCDGPTCVASGTNAATYNLTAADQGQTIKVAVTATNAASESSPPVESAPTGVIAAAPPPDTPPQNIGPPTISGIPRLGQQLTAGEGSWSGTPEPVVTRRWERCANFVCSDTGASGSTYTLTTADVGRSVRVVEIASNSAGTEQAESAAVGPVDAPPEQVSTGDHRASHSAQGRRSPIRTWRRVDGHAAADLDLQWQRCLGAACTDIPTPRRARTG